VTAAPLGILPRRGAIPDHHRRTMDRRLGRGRGVAPRPGRRRHRLGRAQARGPGKL